MLSAPFNKNSFPASEGLLISTALLIPVRRRSGFLGLLNIQRHLHRVDSWGLKHRVNLL